MIVSIDIRPFTERLDPQLKRLHNESRGWIVLSRRQDSKKKSLHGEQETFNEEHERRHRESQRLNHELDGEQKRLCSVKSCWTLDSEQVRQTSKQERLYGENKVRLDSEQWKPHSERRCQTVSRRGTVSRRWDSEKDRLYSEYSVQ